jgi:hypothetical protein
LGPYAPTDTIIEDREIEMKSTVKSTIELIRHSETGDVTTYIRYVKGIPTTMVIEQMPPTKHVQRIEMTLSESRFFRYALNEFENFNRYADSMDNDDD